MADISKIKTIDGTTYNIKDSTARAQSGVTGVKGSAESSYRTGNVNLTAANIGAVDTAGTGLSKSGTTLTNAGVRSVSTSSNNGGISVNTNGTSSTIYPKGFENGYLNIHPENGPILIPFMHNDIAHLLKRGGSVIVKYDGTAQTIDVSNCFDGSGSYWAINPTGTTTIVFEVTCHKAFGWTTWIYVDFGATAWRSNSVKIEVMNSNYAEDAWTQKYSSTTNASGHISVSVAHTPVGASNAGAGFNKIRFTFSDWGTATIFRLSQLGVYNYGSIGLRETYMSRGSDDYVFRNITPNANNTYALGNTSHKWSNVYATTFTGNVTGNVSGTAANVTGVVAVANGGTGQTSAKNAANAFMNALDTGSSTPADADYYISQYVNGGTTTTTYHRRPMSALWAYIKGKIESLVLSTSTSSTSTTTAATSSAVKTAYDLANTANGTANTALSGVNGNLIYDHTFTISNGVATFTPHVYQKGTEVTTNYNKSCFTWKYRLINGSEVALTTKNDRGCDVTISTLGYGGHVIGTFTPPA